MWHRWALAAVIGWGAIGLADPPPVLAAEATTGGATHLAVLPFDDLTKNPKYAYLSQGVAEALMGGMRYVANLTLIDRLQTAKAIKEQAFSQSGLIDARSALSVGKALAANWLLVGSYQIVGDQIRLDARLLDAQTGVVDQRRVFQVSGYVDEVFGLQDRLANLVAKALGAEPSPEEQQRMTAVIRSTDNPDAFRLYLQGRDQFAKASPEGFESAVALYRQALAIDEAYALAWAGIAQAEAVWGFRTKRTAQQSGRHFDAARQAAQRAVSLMPSLAEAHRALAFIEANAPQRRTEEAQRHARQALALNPNDAETWYVLGSALGGDVAAYRRAISLDPGLAMVHNDLGYVLLRTGDLDGATSAFNRMRSLAPTAPEGHVGLARVAMLRKDYERAVTLLQGSLRLTPGEPDWQLDLALALQGLGRNEEAIQATEVALAADPNLARGHLLMGTLWQKSDRDKAVRHFRQFLKLAPHDPQAEAVRDWLEQ